MSLNTELKLTQFFNKIYNNRFFIPVLLGLIIYLSFFHNIAFVPLFDRDEGAFSEATREMFVRDDFISTYLDGKPRYDKPILIYWFQAIGVLIFGINEFAFRLPSAVFAITGIFVLKVRRFWLQISIFIIGLLISISRIMVGIHWPLDILSGLVIGWISAWISLKIIYHFDWNIGKVGQKIVGIILFAAAIYSLYHDTGYSQALFLHRIISVVCILGGGHELLQIYFPLSIRRILRKYQYDYYEESEENPSFD